MTAKIAIYQKARAMLTVIFALIVAMLSFDIYIPSMPDMTNYFSTTQEWMQFSLTAAVLGSSLATFILGPLSDSIGRRQLIVFSMLGCAVSSYILACAPNIETFIFFRFVQGIFYTAPTLLGFSIAADLFEPKKAAIYYAYLTTALTGTLIAAPAIGGFFAHYYQWQAIFYFLSIANIIAFILLYWLLPETLAKTNKFSWSRSVQAYGEIIASPNFYALALVPSFMVGGIVAFITNANYHFINQLGMDVGIFAIYQSVIMSANALFSYLAAFMIAKKGLELTARMSVALCVLGGLLFGMTSIAIADNYNVLTAVICLYAAGLGFGFAAFTALSMNNNVQNAGAASAMLTMIRNVVMVICVSVAGNLYSGQVWQIAVFLTANVALILVLSRSYFRSV